MKNLTLTRPIVFLDIESTGLDPAIDRIVTLAMVKFTASGARQVELSMMFNPGFNMTEENIAIHGLTNEMVSGAPVFASEAPSIFEFLNGSDLAGFGVINFDVQILWQELYRAGIEWDLSDTHVIDASVIFKVKEPRDLTAAVKFYCGREHADAHDAMADTQASIDVLQGQLARYPELAAMDVAALAKFCKTDRDGGERMDLAGTVVRDKDGVPRYTHKKVRGVAVADDPSYASWMVSKDFPTETKIVLRKLLSEIYAAQNSQPKEQEQLF